MSLVLVFTYLGEVNALSEYHFLSWDAMHLHFIVQNGYDFARSAFFPLFPFLWKLSSLSPGSVSLLNGFIFLFSFSMLANQMKLKYTELLSFLAIPSFIFMFLPYSESLLFLFAVIFYYSLKNDRIGLACMALFLMSLTKPTASIFIPAIIVAEFLGQSNFQMISRRIVLLSLTIVVGNLLVFCFQYYSLGVWFTFFDAQAGWGNGLKWPLFPLTTWNHPHVIWIDSIALWISMIAGILLIYFIYQRHINGRTFSRVLSYSLLYLVGTGLFVLLFRGGHLFSLNRFVFATPFLLMATVELKKHFKFEKSTKVIATLIISFVIFSMLLFGSYLHIRLLISYVLLSILVGLWFGLQFFKLKKAITWSVIMMLIIFQLFYLVAILHGEWLA